MNFHSSPRCFCAWPENTSKAASYRESGSSVNDRRVEIHIQSRNEIGDEIRRILILEIMGRHSNIVITDADYRILDGVKHLTPNNNSRTIMPGFDYTAPPTEDKLVKEIEQSSSERTTSRMTT